MSILQYPQHKATLRLKSAQVVGQVSQDLIDQMTSFQGLCLGLSAVQLGVPIRLIMIKYGIGHLFLSNPIILKQSLKTWAYEEGCLSIEGGEKLYYFRRPKRIKVSYTDLDGNQKTIKAQGLTARSLQHEIDHLEGKLIIDYNIGGSDLR